VIDTNVVVSAFINPGGKPSQIMKMILSRKAELCYNSTILGEYESVMLRPKFSGKIDSANIQRFINLLRSIGTSYSPLPVTVRPTPADLPDESDRIFYETAVGSGSILVSGNIKHFPKEPFIMSPSDFLKQIDCQTISG
jgi:putative PIN family toxin of toxin-antitoxin system